MASKRKILKIVFTIIGGFLIICLILAGAIIYKWETNTSPCVPDVPARIGEVPNTARWIGGCDGGHWFDIEEIQSESNKYLIAIYFDYNGELYERGYFKLDCDKGYKVASDLLDKILYYEGEIRMADHCDLVPIISEK